MGTRPGLWSLLHALLRERIEGQQEGIMGGFRRSGKGRGLQEVDIALRLTVVWAIVAVISFWPKRQDNLTLLIASTGILLLVWAVAIASLRVRLGRRKTLEQL